MNVKKEQLEKNLVELTIEVDAKKFEEGVTKAYIKNVSKINIPGFRKGKAPQKIIEKYYGEGVFYEDAINIVCPDAYDEAVKETNIEPVDRPEIEIVQVGNGENLIFKVKVITKPEVKISDYKGIEIEKKVYNVTDEDINSKLKAMQERAGRLVSVSDRPVKEGDTAVIDFEGFIDDVAFDGGKGTDHSLVIGSGQFIPGFEEQLIGKNVGESVDVNVSFPEEYHAEELKGKPALFKVVIKEIKFKELPEQDDEFAKDVSEFNTLDELKNDIKEKMEKDNEQRAKNETESELISKTCEKAEIEIPSCMIEQAIENYVKDFEFRMQQQGLSMEQYFNYTGSNIDDFKKQYEEQAKTQVKTRLTLEAIGKLENIEITDEDIEKEYKRLSDMYRTDIENVKKYIEKDMLKTDLIIPKTIEFLMENAKIS